ncbi:MAG: tetratricopeptide repeat protein [Burkholderiaceae bacterium]
MRGMPSAINRRQMLSLCALCAIVLSTAAGLPHKAAPAATPVVAPVAPLAPLAPSEVLMPMPGGHESLRLQIEALLTPVQKTPEQRVLQAAEAFAAMRVSGQETLAGLIERQLQREDLKDFLPARLMLADLLQYQHRFGEARDLLRTLEAPAAGRTAYWRLRANLYRIGGQISEMANSCQQGASISQSGWTVLCKAEVAALRGESAERDRLLSTLLTDHGESLHKHSDLLTWAGDLFVRSGAIESAAHLFRKALLVAPRAYTVDRLIQFQLTHEGPEQAARTLNWWEQTGQAPEASVQLLKALISAANGVREPATQLLHALQTALPAKGVPSDTPVHWRELARLAIALEPAGELARQYATQNWQQQKEPIDAVLLARAASAGGDEIALTQLSRELETRQMAGLMTDFTLERWL